MLPMRRGPFLLSGCSFFGCFGSVYTFASFSSVRQRGFILVVSLGSVVSRVFVGCSAYIWHPCLYWFVSFRLSGWFLSGLHPFVVNKISISNVMFGFSCNELALYCYQMYHIHIFFNSVTIAEPFL